MVGAVVEVDVEKIVSNSARAAYRSEAEPTPFAVEPLGLGDGDWFVALLVATKGVEETP